MTTRVFLQGEYDLSDHRNELVVVMEEEHDYILTGIHTERMKEIYRELDPHVRAYLDLLRIGPGSDPPGYVREVQAASHELLPILNDAVYAFQDEAGQMTSLLEGRERLIVFGTILTLILETLLLFLPIILAERRNQKIIGEERERFKTLLDHASDGIHVLDEEGKLYLYSQSFARNLGYEFDEMAGKRVSDWHVSFPDDRRALSIGNLMLHPRTFEARHRRKDGSEIEVQISTTNIVLAGKTYLYASQRDITQEKESGRRVQDLLRDLKHVYHLAHMTSWKFFPRERNFLFSPENQSLHGMVDTPVISAEDFMAYVHLEDRPVVAEAVRAAVEENRHAPVKYRALRNDGSIRYLYAFWELKYDDKGEFIEANGFNRDISEETLLQQGRRITGESSPSCSKTRRMLISFWK